MRRLGKSACRRALSIVTCDTVRGNHGGLDGAEMRHTSRLETGNRRHKEVAADRALIIQRSVA